MIIVSQDKLMIFNFNNIETLGVGNPLENNDGNFTILIETKSDNRYPIAEYKTEERAKEVLQEIICAYKGKVLVQLNTIADEKKLKELEKHLDNNHYIYDLKREIKSLNNTVYEMPEK